MKFNHLNVPTHWQNYWSRYPEGHTILEALISWVSQVDSMVDNVNNWNMYLDGFVSQFDTELQTTVKDTLSDWQESGFLGELITEALQTQMDELEGNTNNKLTIFENQLDTLQLTTDGLKTGLGETFTTYNELLTAYPDGDTKDHVVASDGHRYYWEDEWKDGGLWNAMTIADNSVTRNKLQGLTPSVNLFSSPLEKGAFVNGAKVGTDFIRSRDYIRVTPNQEYVITNDKRYALRVWEYTSPNEANYVGNKETSVFTTGATTEYIMVSTYQLAGQNDLTTKINLNKGSVPLPYETPTPKLPSDFYDKRSVQPQHTSFINRTKNLFDKNATKKGYYVNQSTGQLMENPIHTATDFIDVKDKTSVVGNQLLQRYAFYTDSLTYISGGVNGLSVPVPLNASKMVVSSDMFDVNTLQIEDGETSTAYEPYMMVSKDYLPESQGSGQSFIGDEDKKYRIVGANIRTPLAAGLPFELHNDAGHEPMGITSVTIVGEGLRIGMPFTGGKVITMTATPHVSMRNEGWEVATTGGLSVHEVHFYKNGVHVPASEVVQNGGSFWFSGVFLV